MVIKKKRGPYTGMFDLPGGSPEKGETEVETLIREVKEETNCDVSNHCDRKKHVIYFDNFIEKNGEQWCLEHTGILFKCQITGEPLSTISDQDSNGAFWIEKSKLTQENFPPFVLIGIQSPPF